MIEWVPTKVGQAVCRTLWFALGGGGTVTTLTSIQSNLSIFFRKKNRVSWDDDGGREKEGLVETGWEVVSTPWVSFRHAILLLPLTESHLKHVLESKDHQYSWSFKRNFAKIQCKDILLLKVCRSSINETHANPLKYQCKNEKACLIALLRTTAYLWLWECFLMEYIGGCLIHAPSCLKNRYHLCVPH